MGAPAGPWAGRAEVLTFPLRSPRPRLGIASVIAQVKFDIAPGLGWGAFRTDGALDAAGLAAGASWMDGLRAAAAPDGLVIGSYLNYIDPYFAGWQAAYHGALLPALEEVKARWDPAQVFSFPQAVLPAAAS